MTSPGKQTYGEDIEGWAELADGLCRLKMASDYAKEFSMKFGRYMSAEDRLEVAARNAKQDGMYWKYWERLVQKIRGINPDSSKKGNKMDKKMHQVTKRMETAEKDIKKGKKKEAVKVLNKAEKKNEKLVKIDRDVRDPQIKKLKKIEKMKKGKC